jgi:hypothetical protein
MQNTNDKGQMLVVLTAPSREAGEELLNPAAPNPRDYHSEERLPTRLLETRNYLEANSHASQWLCRRMEFMAPYTTLIGPSMCGKTRLLIELAQIICVPYICLRPRNST